MYFDLKYGFHFSFSFSFVMIFLKKTEKHIKVYNNSILFTVMNGGILLGAGWLLLMEILIVISSHCH